MFRCVVSNLTYTEAAKECNAVIFKGWQFVEPRTCQPVKMKALYSYSLEPRTWDLLILEDEVPKS
jgi:hypothetical protein